MKILITGGTGLVGSYLIPKLIEKGHQVNILSRSTHQDKNPNINYHQWDIKKGEIDSDSLKGVDTIIHLAGAGIADKKWTPERKKILIDSRVKSLELIYSVLVHSKSKPKKLISTSGIGYYGAITTDNIFTENDKPGDDFVAEICIKWEDAALKFKNIGLDVFIPRVAVVLTEKGGALERMKTPTKFNIGSPLGSGKQWMPWIHIEDLCNIYEKAIENESLTGVYNASSSQYIQNKNFSKTLASVLGKAHFVPNVPSFVLKLLFGEMANIILEGSRVSNEKIIQTGFDFQYQKLDKALEDLLK